MYSHRRNLAQGIQYIEDALVLSPELASYYGSTVVVFASSRLHVFTLPAIFLLLAATSRTDCWC